jgi:hypothetical protein
LTKGASAEAEAGRATWKNVSKETFERFVQFAYTGDYSIPKTEDRTAIAQEEKTETSVPTPPTSPKAPNGIRNGSVSSISTIQTHERSAAVAENELREDPATEKLIEDEGTILNYPSTTGKKNRKKKRGKSEVKPSIPEPEAEPEPVKERETVQELPEPEERAESVSVDQEQEAMSAAVREESPEELTHMLTVDFHTLSFPLLAPRDNYDGTCEPAADFEKDRSYSKVFLSHASLYVLGGAQLVDSLKALALFKLHKTLSAFELDNENIGDITDLARYAYSEDGKKVNEGIGGLRGLVCQYMARHAMELSQDTKFMNFLAEGGQVVKDFLKFQLQRKNLSY